MIDNNLQLTNTRSGNSYQKKYLLLILLFSLLVFSPTFTTYFSQDDWTFLSHVYQKPFISIFPYYPEAIYRPIGQQLFFYLNSKLFGLNPVGYHLMVLLIHLLNIWLLEKLIRLFRPLIWADLVLLAVFAFNPLHLVALNWLTQVDLEIAVLFSLLTVWFFRQAGKKRRRWYLAATTSLILALLSHEVTAVLPLFLLLGFRLRREKGEKAEKKERRWAILMIAFAGLIVVGKYLINPFPLERDYSLGISISSLLTALRWYGFRGLFIPEGVKNMAAGLQLVSLLPAIVLMAVMGRTWLRGLVVFLVALTPVLLLSRHLLAAYGTVALAMMVLWMSRSPQLPRQLSLRLVLLTIVTLAGVSGVTVRAIRDQHWTTTRGELSRRLTEQYLGSSLAEQEKLMAQAQDYQLNPEIYFATMMGKQYGILLRLR